MAQRWRFLTQPKSLLKQGRTEVLPNARVSDLGAILLQRGYQVRESCACQRTAAALLLRFHSVAADPSPLLSFVLVAQVFVKDGSLYGFKGLAGKLGPIGVHAALLLCLFGTAWSGFGTLKGNVMCPEVREQRTHMVVWWRHGDTVVTSRLRAVWEGGDASCWPGKYAHPCSPSACYVPTRSQKSHEDQSTLRLQGQDFQVASFLQPSSPIASMPASASNVIHVNKFTIDYRPDGSVAQVRALQVGRNHATLCTLTIPAIVLVLISTDVFISLHLPYPAVLLGLVAA